jgi:hypothetical protein
MDLELFFASRLTKIPTPNLSTSFPFLDVIKLCAVQPLVTLIFPFGIHRSELQIALRLIIFPDVMHLQNIFLQSNEVFQALAVGLSGIDQEQVRIPQERKVQQFALLVCVCLRKKCIILDGGFQRSSNQDCQIFHGTTYQNGEYVSNDHKIYQMAIKYTKWS